MSSIRGGGLKMSSLILLLLSRSIKHLNLRSAINVKNLSLVLALFIIHVNFFNDGFEMYLSVISRRPRFLKRKSFFLYCLLCCQTLSFKGKRSSLIPIYKTS